MYTTIHILIAKKVFKFSVTIIIDNNAKLALEHDPYIGSSKQCVHCVPYVCKPRIGHLDTNYTSYIAKRYRDFGFSNLGEKGLLSTIINHQFLKKKTKGASLAPFRLCFYMVS